MTAVTATILSQGEAIDPAYRVLSIDISKEVSRIPDAQISLIDGDAAQRGFAISNSAVYEPGKEIEIRLGYEGASDTTLFKGLVIRHGVRIDDHGSILTIEMKDAAIKLTHPRKNAVFRELSDAEIVSRILQQASLEEETIDTTEPQHAEIIQYYATDWDFILSRAEIQGLLLSVDGGKISLKSIDLNATPAQRFEVGLSEIYDFEIEADALHQFPGIESVAWDLETQALTQASTAELFELAQGNLDPAGIADSIGFDTTTLSHPVPLHPQERQAWANAGMSKSRMAMIRGRISLPGFTDIKLLDVVEVSGVGERFSGRVLVTGIRHRVGDEGWRTDLQFGLTPERFCRQPNIQAVPAAGLLPPVSGLQIGVVDGFEEDPENQLRVKITLPALGDDAGAIWARLMSPDAGAGHGYFFRPQTGDEVVVGFFNNDPRQAVILGAMFSSTNAPPEPLSDLSEDNMHKAIVTHKGTTIGFVDADKASVYIETANNNKLLLDDDNEQIQLSDQHGNSITMDSNGIQINSSADLKIEASGNVEIKGQQVDVK